MSENRQINRFGESERNGLNHGWLDVVSHDDVSQDLWEGGFNIFKDLLWLHICLGDSDGVIRPVLQVEISGVGQAVQSGFNFTAGLEFMEFDRERELLLVIELTSQAFRKHFVDSNITEEDVKFVDEFPLILELSEIFHQGLVAHDFGDARDVHVFDDFLELLAVLVVFVFIDETGSGSIFG